LHFTVTAGAAHAEVFQCPTESGKFMALEMRDRDQGVCFNYFSPYADRFQKLTVYLDFNGILPFDSVAHDQWCVDYRVCKAVFNGAGKGRHRFLALSGVKCG